MKPTGNNHAFVLHSALPTEVAMARRAAIRMLFALFASGSILFSIPASADSSWAGYSWLSSEIPHDVAAKQEGAIKACVSTVKDAQSCVGTTIHTCAVTAPLAQCYTLEAEGWESLGYRFFQQLSRELPTPEVLQTSQTHWIHFAQAECALTAEVDRKDLVLQRLEIARCDLELASQRALMLRAHVADLPNTKAP